MPDSRNRLRANTRRRTAVAAWLLCAAAFFHAPVFSRQTGESEQQILHIQRALVAGDLSGARRMLDEAVRRFPASAGLDNLSGVIEVQEGKAAAAEDSFQRAIKRAPRFTGAYLNLARLYQERIPTDARAARRALDVYAQVLRYDAQHSEANYQSATLLTRQGEYQAALEHLARLPEAAQGGAAALSVRCAAYAGLGERTRAEEAAARLIAHPNFSELDVRTVQTALPAGADELLLKLLRGLQQRQVLSPEMARLLDDADNMRTKQPVDRKPASVPQLLELARAAHRQGDFKKALGYVAHARGLEPQNAALHYYFGLVCLNLNLLAEAHNSFSQAVRVEPDNASYNYALGAASAFRHDPAEALPYFKKYLALKPQDPRGQLALGAALFRAKDYAAAAAMLTEAAKHQENASVAHYYLGSIARHNKRTGEAIHELELALKINPDYPDALAELGQCYLLKKDYARATRHLRRALEINPDHYAANFNLLMLYTRTKDKALAAQERRFAQIQKLREEKTQEFLRLVEVRPFENP